MVRPGAFTPSNLPLPAPARPKPSARNAILRVFGNPLPGDYPLTNFFDHNLPFQYYDRNGYLLNTWGVRSGGVDGHNGYDWLAPAGTPVLAVADGVVIRAGAAPPFHCAPFDRTVNDSIGVEVLHRGPGGERIVSSSSHLARVDVQVGQQVRAGEQIGLTGQSGCTTYAHIHFQVKLQVGATLDSRRTIDPYGWEGSQPDPWASHSQGAPSLWLWKEGQAPALYLEERRPIPANTALPPIVITVFRWMGWKDSENPNNQFLQIELNGQAAGTARLDLTGYTIRNNRGDIFRFPAGFAIEQDRPVRVFSGQGTSTASDLYWGSRRGVWDSLGDCARIAARDGRTVDTLAYFEAPCR